MNHQSLVRVIKFSPVFSIALAFACSESKVRPETADKFKPIMVAVNSPDSGKIYEAPLPGQEVYLDFHFIGPPDLRPVTLVSSDPQPKPLTLPLSNWTIGANKVEVHPGLQHVIIRAKVVLPKLAEINRLSPDFESSGLVRFRYTLIASDGVRTVPIAGDFPVYRDAAAIGDLSSLTGTIDSPQAGQVLDRTTLEISGSLSNPLDEPIKLAWFVSAGEIKNRRAAKTEWKLPGSGSFTLILTIRGKETRNTSLILREVTIP